MERGLLRLQLEVEVDEGVVADRIQRHTLPGSGFSGAFTSRAAVARRSSSSERFASPALLEPARQGNRARAFSSPG